MTSAGRASSTEKGLVNHCPGSQGLQIRTPPGNVCAVELVRQYVWSPKCSRTWSRNKSGRVASGFPHMARGCVGAIAVLLMAAGACAFSVPGLHVSRARLPASQALRLRVRSRPQLVVCQVSRSAVFRVPGAPYALHPPMTPPPACPGRRPGQGIRAGAQNQGGDG